jgi:Ca-activated chloride channel family protein
MSWEKSIWLYAIPLLLPLMLLIWRLLHIRSQRLHRHFSKRVIEATMPKGQFKISLLRYAFLMLSVAFLFLALANPQVPGKEKEVILEGSDVVFVLDISASMLANDIQPDRLSFAKRFIEQLLFEIRGERIGLVFFAGSAFVQMPLSNDHTAAILMLRNAHPDLWSDQGTSIGDALETASTLYDETQASGRLMLLISDGEDHEMDTKKKAALLQKKGIRFISIGIGTSQGALVPAEYTEGKQVISKFDGETLKEISSAAEGSFFKLSTNNEKDILTKVKAEINNQEKTKKAMMVFHEKESRFAYPLLLAILFFIAYLLWPYPIMFKTGK